VTTKTLVIGDLGFLNRNVSDEISWRWSAAEAQPPVELASYSVQAVSTDDMASSADALGSVR